MRGFLKVLICILCCKLCSSQYNFASVVPSDCSTVTDQFYNTANQKCENCWPNTTATSDFLFCQCKPGYRRSVPSTVQPFNCFACPSLTTTLDGLSCTTCPLATPLTTGICTCSVDEALVDRNNDGTALTTATCQTCTSGTGPSGITGGCSACDTCSTSCVATTDSICLSTIPTAINSQSTSQFIIEKAGAAAVGCALSGSNITACQALANMCVMEMYAINLQGIVTACSLFGELPATSLVNTQNAVWFKDRPWLFYDSYAFLTNPLTFSDPTNAQDALLDTTIPTGFQFKGANSVLNIVVMSYDQNGNYLGRQYANTGILQLCPDKPSVKSAAFVFGTSYSSSCSLSSLELSNSALYPPRFYELNLEYTDTSGATQLYAIPVLNTNLLLNGDTVNLGGNSNWILVRRFFLVDNLSGVAPGATTTSSVTYASEITLNIELQNPTGSGLIYPPYLRVSYLTQATPASTAEDVTVTTSFSVTYSSNMQTQGEGVMIALIVFGILALIYSWIETSSWRRRMGLQYIDGSSLMMLLLFCMSNVANAFFIVWCGFASVTLLFYKGQDLVTTTLPDANLMYNYDVFIAVAFAFKLVEVLGMIYQQSAIDIFLVDWERPRVKDVEGKVSIWRTYFIANEWNEIQTVRKIVFSFQLMAVVFFLEFVGFKDLALENPNSSFPQSSTAATSGAYIPAYNRMLRFAVSSLIFLVIAAIQVLYKVAIHERFIHDKIGEFVDLCSVSNVSVFLLTHLNYGYYIHGRSVYGKADTDMMEMNKMLKREEENLTGARGLEAGKDAQTFEIAVPQNFRLQFDKIYQVLDASKNQPNARGASSSETKLTESVTAYSKMKEFLTAFIEHSIRDLDYHVTDKLLLEKLVDYEFKEPVNGAFFYNDSGNSFTNTLFYGREFALLTFDILLFTLVDKFQENFLLAAVVTYLVGKVIAILRQFLGQHYLAKRTLVDKRFLI